MQTCLKLCAVSFLVSCFLLAPASNSFGQNGTEPGESPIGYTGFVAGYIDLVMPFDEVSGPDVEYFSESTIINGTNVSATFFQTIEVHETGNDTFIDGVSETYSLWPTTQKTGWKTARTVSLVEDEYIVTGTLGWFSSPGITTQLDLEAEFFEVEND